MPKSKRNRVVSLTKTKKKGLEGKKELINKLQDAIDRYNTVYLFRFEDMKNEKMKELREELKGDARFFLGSNKVMQVALGRDSSSAARTDLDKLSCRIRGFCGLLLTNLSRDDVINKFERLNSREEQDKNKTFAKAGKRATATIELNAGPVIDENGYPLSHTLEPYLNKSGMPTKLNKGVVELIADTTVCEKGKPLSVDQAHVLKMLGIKMACFKLWLDSCWANDSFEIICDEESPEDISEEDDDDQLEA